MREFARGDLGCHGPDHKLGPECHSAVIGFDFLGRPNVLKSFHVILSVG